MKKIMFSTALIAITFGLVAANACDDQKGAQSSKKSKKTMAAAETPAIAESKQKITTPAFDSKKCTEVEYSQAHTGECKIERK